MNANEIKRKRRNQDLKLIFLTRIRKAVSVSVKDSPDARSHPCPFHEHDHRRGNLLSPALSSTRRVEEREKKRSACKFRVQIANFLFGEFSPWPNGFPSPPQVGVPIMPNRFAERGPPGEANRSTVAGGARLTGFT
jgi:hypothetical protein